MSFDTTTLSLYAFTIFLIICIYILERFFPSSAKHPKTRTGVDYYTRKPYIQQDSPTTEPDPEPTDPQITAKQLNKIISDYEAVGIRFTQTDLQTLSKLHTIADVCQTIDNTMINK